MGAGNEGGSGKISGLNYGSQLERMGQSNARRGKDLYNSASPLYGEQVGQTLEALRTGGVGAQIPIIQRAVEQSKLGTSNAMTGTADRLRGAGISGTPFGQNILANQAQQGATATSRIPTEIAQGFINNAGNVSGQGFTASGNYANLGANTMGNLQQMDLQRALANQSLFKDMMATMYSAATPSVGVCLHPDTFIETPIGDRMIQFLRVGDRVMTLDTFGNKIEARIRARTEKPVPASHKMARVTCPRGDAWITPAHPLPDGTPVDDGILAVAGKTDQTMDIAVDGPTGVYFVLGLALGSTLDARHVARKAVA